MHMNDLFSCACLVAYAMATVCSLTGVLARSDRMKKTALLLCTAGLAFHTLWIISAVVSGTFAAASRGFYLLPLSWVPAAAVLACSRRFRLEAASHFAAPWSFFLCSIAAGFAGTNAAMPFAGALFIVHLAMVFVGVGVMAVAAAAGTLFLVQNKALKKKSILTLSGRSLPSLSVLDRVNALSTLIGFPCYSLGLLCGFLWSRISWNASGSDVKEWISVLILLIYAVLFHQRQALGWQGRKPAILAIIIFSASLFSMLVVNTLLPTQHGL